jgi:hypothetical protein
MKRGLNRPHQPKPNLPITLNDAASRQPPSMDFTPMSDPERENEPLGVFNPGDHPKVANPDSPKFAEAFALHRMAGGTRVIDWSQTVAKETKSALRGLRAEFLQFARRGPLELNPPRHGAG